jgi:single-strand DNA-binding protein
MARGLNKIQIIGRLGRDPEMRYTSQGTPVTNFSVATGGKWTDRNGNERDDTEWFRVEAWDRLAETCNQYLTKGKEVYIEGRIKTRKYTDRDGIERTVTEVVANNMLMLGGRGDSGSSGSYDNSRDDNSYEEDEPAPRSRGSGGESRGSGGESRGGWRNQPQPVSDDVGDDDLPF